jgi:hypothetical protein
VTFKDLRKIIAAKNKEIERESKFYNPSYYWKGRKVVSLDQWPKTLIMELRMTDST